MKKISTWSDHLAGLIFKLALCVCLVLTFASTQFSFTVTKKKNSFIEDVGNVVDGGYSIVKRVKSIGSD